VLPAVLAAAITRTVGASSLKATELDEEPSGGSAGSPASTIVFVYQAPDRLEMDLPGGGSDDKVIRIGEATYAPLPLSAPGQPAPAPTGWIEGLGQRGNQATIKETLFGLLVGVERAQAVTGAPPHYSFRLHTKTTQATIDLSGTVIVTNGWVTSLSVMSTVIAVTKTPPGAGTLPAVQQLTKQFTYGDFNAAPPVEPPPASKVTVEPNSDTCVSAPSGVGVVASMTRGCLTTATTAPAVHLPPDD